MKQTALNTFIFLLFCAGSILHLPSLCNALPGDLEGNGTVTPHDVIRGLGLLSGQDTSLSISGDQDGDQRLTMTEVIYGLRLATRPWPIEDGRYGVPAETFTLPGPKNDGGMYYDDIQKSFPEVNWQTLDRLYIPAAHYKYIRIGKLPNRDPDRPLIISNIGGQVRVGGLGHYYVFGIDGGSNWILTGRYDPVSETGDAAYPGHRGGRFSNSQGTYGILVDDAFGINSDKDFAGLAVSKATAFEIEYLEVRNTSFCGMSIKTNNVASPHMEDVLIHDNYVHDTVSEGMYIGSTQSPPQHKISDWKIYNNRILRTGTEALQLGQLAGHTEVFNNVIGPAAIDWRAAFQQYQDSNLQLGIREGHVDIHNNIFIGAANSLISLFAHEIDGDSSAHNTGVTFSDNYFDGTRFLGMYANKTALPNMTYRFERNRFRGFRFERDEVYGGTANTHLLRSANSTTPHIFIDNVWSAPENFSNISSDGNSTGNNSSGYGNQKEESERIVFVNNGLPTDFDYLNLEMWAERATLGGNDPINYERNEIVMHLGIPYQCRQEICASSLFPPDNPGTWQILPEFPDDFRVMPMTTWHDLGLSPYAE